MAIVQISKIQHRRGRTKTYPMPQLASGELGWSIDEQKLYVGNGSVAEGAPAVGNTEILTTNSISTIFDVAGYQHSKNSNVYQNTVQQTLQERLEERVSASTWGAKTDNTDSTVALQNAINDLYLISPASIGLVLELPAGTFTISESLIIPPFTTIRGAGKDKTVIKQTGNFPVFITKGANDIGYVELAELSYLTQPRNISITDLTLEHTVAGQTIAVLNSTRNSYFGNVKFKGVWEYSIGSTLGNDYGLQITAESTANTLTSEENLFEKCDFVNVSYGVHSEYNIDSNTFTDCLFYQVGQGFYGNATAGNGRDIGPSNNKFVNNKFSYVLAQGINILNGTGNLSTGNKFVSVGNNGGSSLTAAFPVIYFGEPGNTSDNDYFERSVDLSNPNATAAYVSEFGGNVYGNHKSNGRSSCSQTSIPAKLFRLGLGSSISSAIYTVHYTLNSADNTYLRTGTIRISTVGSTVEYTDDYEFTGAANSLSENIKLTAAIVDNTIEISYTNSGVSGYLNYWYEVNTYRFLSD